MARRGACRRAAQAERPALLVGAAGAADAVDVDFRVGRHVDVDHRFELGNVQPARGDVGGDEHRAAAVGELDQHLVALALFQIAVQGQRLKPRARSTSSRSRHCCLVLQKASVLTGR
jgi:hypothetical protein